MRFLPYAAASSEPNVIVDGTSNDRTLITLFHWRRSGTRADLMADTSTAIVFNYLDRPDLHIPADIVSNNHFDEDGLSAYALLEPEAAASRRDLLIDVAQAGDFGVYRSRRAARRAFAISAHADPATSPFPRPLFDRPAPQVEEGLYRALLDVLLRLLADIDSSPQERHSLSAQGGPVPFPMTSREGLAASGKPPGAPRGPSASST